MFTGGSSSGDLPVNICFIYRAEAEKMFGNGYDKTLDSMFIIS